MVVNVEKLLKMVKNGDFSKFVKKWWNVEKCWWKHLKKIFAQIFFYTQDIKNIIFNPKFYQHFLPSLVITLLILNSSFSFFLFLFLICGFYKVHFLFRDFSIYIYDFRHCIQYRIRPCQIILSYCILRTSTYASAGPVHKNCLTGLRLTPIWQNKKKY